VSAAQLPAPAAAADRSAGAASGLYRMVWRWHFFAGLLCIPVIVLLCLSGIVWLMRSEITTALHGDATHVRPAATAVSYQDQLAAVAKRYPGSTPYQLGTPTGKTQATMLNITTRAGRDLTVWVDPYRGAVTGSRDNATDPTQIALKLHGSLMTGSWLGNAKWGDRLIEIVAGWTILLVLTGLYLFWPRGRKPGRWRRAFTPRLRARSTNRRIAWRDVHAITGVVFAFATLFFLATGMIWTGWWGVRYGEVSTRLGASYPAGMWDGASSQTADSLKRTGKGGWLSTSLPVFPSGVRPVAGSGSVENQPGQANHAGHHHDAKVSWQPGTAAPIDAVVATAQRLGYPQGFSLTFPDSPTGSWAAWYGPDSDPKPNVSATQERMLYIDQYSATPIRDFRFSQFGAAAKASDLGIAIHEGRELGWITKIAMLVATLAILLSCATSLVMWRKRKPKGVGAPRRTSFPRRRDAVAVLAIIASLSALFPLLGLSILAVLALDMLVIRQLPPLRRALAG
jgi:uncharacterized iron-regulated membrane protein